MILDVALDSEKRAHFNTLVIRPTYRITLRMGAIEDLFPDPPDTPKGRMARLQVLGLFYFPLRHKAALRALETCWAWVKEKVFKVASDEEADRRIQDALRNRVVGPAKGGFEEASAGGLPPAAADPDDPKEENFAKIRVPGGYAQMASDDMTSEHYDPAYPHHMQRHEIYDVEAKYRRDNRVLGRIPIIARVERRIGEDLWAPAAGAPVCVQLVPPYDLPRDEKGRSPAEQVSPPPLLPSIREIVEEEEDRDSDPADPQATNCPWDRGGKRGESVAGDILATQKIAGFHRAHRKGRPLPHEPFPPAKAARIPFAVRGETNGEGEAGVVLLPSTMGGDRYRIRAFVAIPEGGGEAAETGTLVVWRNVRISRYLRKEVTPPLNSWMVEEAKYAAGVRDEADYLERASLVGENGEFVGLPSLEVERLAEKFAHAYCEVEVDGGNLEAEEISDEDYARAYGAALEGFEKEMRGNLKKYCVPRLFYEREISGKTDVVDHVAMRTPGEYDLETSDNEEGGAYELFGAEPSKDDFRRMDRMAYSGLLPGFLRALSKEGFLPGLTIVQGGKGCTWSLLRLIAPAQGVAYGYRGLFVWDGVGRYENIEPGTGIRDFTGTVAHEMGHCLFREHAPGRDRVSMAKVVFTPEAGGAKPERHDPLGDDPEKPGNVCLMSYKIGPDVFCARCLLALRGWDISRLVYPSSSPEIRVGFKQGVSCREYERLRSKTPTQEIKDSVNQVQEKRCWVCDHEVTSLEADHIVPMYDIVRMPGFRELAEADKLEVLNLRENFVGICKSCNASKRNLPWGQWAGHRRRRMNPDFRMVMEMKTRRLVDRIGAGIRLRRPGAGWAGATALENVTAPTEGERVLAASPGTSPEQRRAREKVAVRFYLKTGKPPEEIPSHLNGIDFNEPVSEGPPPPVPERLFQLQYPSAEGRTGEYFAVCSGSPATRLGVESSRKDRRTGMVEWRDERVVEMRVAKSTGPRYLRSTSAPVMTSWTESPVMTTGGSEQVYVPRSEQEAHGTRTR